MLLSPTDRKGDLNFEHEPDILIYIYIYRDFHLFILYSNLNKYRYEEVSIYE